MSETLPDYWISEITASVNTVLSNISNIKNSSDYVPRTSTFFFITDTHWRGNAKRSPEVALQTANAIDLAIDNDANISSIFKTANANGYRRVIFAGDMIKGNAGTKEAAYEEGNDFLSAWDGSFRVAIALGNHDTNREGNTSENILSTDEMHDSFLARESSYVTRDYLNKDVEIGYWDDTVNKIRFFMFRHYSYSDLSSSVWNKFNEYLEDIVDAGWGAIFFCHAFWNLTEDTLNPEHMQKPSGSITFASKLADICSSKGIIPIALMVGHIHADDSYLLTTENHNKILITSTVCDTYVGEATKIPSPSMTLGNSTEQAFEIVQIDMNYGKLYLTRVGAGFDRIFDIPAMHSSLIPVINPEIYNEGYNIMSVKFINLENLSDFWNNAKNYIDDNDNTNRQEIEDQLYNWQKTDKAFKVQCEPVPDSELHPIVDFSFTETLPAEGEKGPNNPSTVTGVESVKIWVCGDNILPGNRNSNYSGEAGTFSTDADGYVSYSSMSDGRAFTYAMCNAQLYLRAGQQYILYTEVKTASTSSYRMIQVLDENNVVVFSASPGNSNNSRIFTPPHDGMYGILYKIYDGVYRFSLYFGSTAMSFKPYKGTNYTISFDSTYYGGSIDLFTGLMTVTHASMMLDENTSFSNGGFSETTNCYSMLIYPSGKETWYANAGASGYASDKFSIETSTPENGNVFKLQSSSTGVSVYFNKTDLNLGDGQTLATVKAAASTWLESYNILFVYKLATPFTVQLTPQQIKSLPSLEGTFKRINTIYTDTDSVQVEYQKYIGIDSTLDNNSVNAIQNKVVNSALNTKVSLSGDETIDGTKTFSNTINGNITGDAGTVAGHIVSKDVPVNAAFTDTTYDPATQSTAGLMSASDKVKLDAVGSVFSFKGSVTDSSSLPSSDNANGDAYLAEDTGHVHVYDGTNFVDIGVWAGIPSATDAQIDALFED